MKGFLGLSAFCGLIAQAVGQTYWYETIAHQGLAPYDAQGSAYVVYRNVKSYGAKGDGVTDDTAAINAAISAGSRCVMGVAGNGGCASTTTSPAVVYFPAGTYIVSSSIKQYYLTQLVGNPNSLPIIKASANFDNAGSSLGLIDADKYDSANQDYFNTNIFYRQIKNLILDMTAMPSGDTQYGIHWPTAQATSLQNIVFKMSTASGTNHRGIFVENGSGGFMTDLVFYGGGIGMNIGSQQFTTRNLTFYNSRTAIAQIWNWGWTYMGLSINNCGVGLDMTNSDGSLTELVGSVVLIDSTMSNTPIGLKTIRQASGETPIRGGSLAVENLVLNNVPIAIQGPSSATLLAGTTGSMTIAAWVDGAVYNPTGPTVTRGSVTAFPRPAGLLSGTNYYVRSKPSYANLASTSFSSVRSAGAKGDGVTDDTAALQAIITSATAAGNVVYFDYGIYKITSVLYFPPGAKIVGESYPTIMAAGSYFTDINNPVPVVRVGSVAGETGVVEWSDMIVSTQGACAGATLIQWNLASPSSTPSGMWDVHTRVGGFTGSNLQVAQCPTTAAQPNAACIAAFMSMRITNIGSGVYMENVWLWTADHDIDDAANTQISVYAGRGLSVESTLGNIWLIGTAVEHHILFQYQFSQTKNIFMGFIQTETPYYEPNPISPGPFTPITASPRNDPDFAQFCSGKSGNCAMAWGLRVLQSTNVNVYGAGLYSWFNNYSTVCSNHTLPTYNSYCQNSIFAIDEGSAVSYSGSTVYAYGFNTVGTVSMIDRNGASVAAQSANTDTYAESIIRFTTQ